MQIQKKLTTNIGCRLAAFHAMLRRHVQRLLDDRDSLTFTSNLTSKIKNPMYNKRDTCGADGPLIGPP